MRNLLFIPMVFLFACSTAPKMSDTIDQHMITHKEAFHQCYEAGVKTNPKLSGQVVVAFVISEDGSVSDSKIKSTTVNNAVLEQCIVETVRRIQFDRPDQTQPLLVSYPFSFSIR